jgi:predicted CDP-diglyceride synthetase/phosphatidate cytidylyltransferase
MIQLIPLTEMPVKQITNPQRSLLMISLHLYLLELEDGNIMSGKAAGRKGVSPTISSGKAGSGPGATHPRLCSKSNPSK